MLRRATVVCALFLGACLPSGTPWESTPSTDPGSENAPSSDPAIPTATELPDDGFAWGDLEPLVLRDDVVLVEEHPCFVDAVSEPGTLELITSCSPGELGVEVGDVLVGAAGDGYLVRALSLTPGATSLRVGTVPATLAELFSSGAFYEAIPWPGDAREVIDLTGRTIASGGGLSLTLGSTQVAVKPTIFVGGSFSEDGVEVAEAVVSFYSHADLELLATAEGPSNGSGETWVHHDKVPFEIFLPTGSGSSVPVVGHLELRISVVFEAESSGPMDVTAGFELRGSAELGQVWDGDEWDSVEERDLELEPSTSEVSVDAGARFEVTLRTRAKLEMTGGNGPIFSLGPYVRLDSRSDCDEVRYQLEGGFDLGAHLNLSTMAEGLVGNYGPWDRDAELVSGTVANEHPDPEECPPEEEEEETPGELPPGDDDDSTPPETDPSEPPDSDDDEPAEPCAPVATISCGQTLSGDTATDPQASQSMDAYPVNVGNYAAPELVYEWAGGAANATLRMPGARPTQVNHDIMVLDGSSGQCSADNAIEWGFNSLEFQPAGSGPFYIVVDGYDQDAGAFELQLSCN